MATANLRWNTGTNNGNEQARQKVAGTGTWSNVGTPEVTTGVSFLSAIKTFTALDNTVYDASILGGAGCSSGIVQKIYYSCPTITTTVGVSSITASIPTSLTLDSVEFILSGTASATQTITVTGTTTTATFIGLAPGTYNVCIVMYATVNGASQDSSANTCCVNGLVIAVPTCTAPTNLTWS
jgi:hypothetical protein